MKKSLLILSLLFPLLAFPGALAQNTAALSGTVTDAASTPLAYAYWQANLQGTQGQQPHYIDGTSAPTVTTGTLSSAGVISGSLGRNDKILPAGTSWQFTICPLASVAKTSTPVSGTCFIVATSASINAASFNAGTFLSPQIATIAVTSAPGAYGYSTSEVKASGLYPNPTQPFPGQLMYTPGSGEQYWDVPSSSWQTLASAQKVVNSINNVSGAFTFNGSGVVCTSTTCSFSNVINQYSIVSGLPYTTTQSDLQKVLVLDVSQGTITLMPPVAGDVQQIYSTNKASYTVAGSLTYGNTAYTSLPISVNSPCLYTFVATSSTWYVIPSCGTTLSTTNQYLGLQEGSATQPPLCFANGCFYADGNGTDLYFTGGGSFVAYGGFVSSGKAPFCFGYQNGYTSPNAGFGAQDDLGDIYVLGSNTQCNSRKSLFTPDGNLWAKTFVWYPQASDPTTLNDGQVWYNSTSNTFKGEQNGATVTFATTGSTSLVSQGSSAGCTFASDGNGIGCGPVTVTLAKAMPNTSYTPNCSINYSNAMITTTSALPAMGLSFTPATTTTISVYEAVNNGSSTGFGISTSYGVTLDCTASE